MTAPLYTHLPDPLPVKVTNLDQLAVGQRSHRKIWTPYALTSGAAWISLAGQTASISARSDIPTSLAPANAYGIIVIVQISSNSTLANNVTWSAYADAVTTGGPTAGSAVTASWANTAAGQTWRTTLDCPLVNGALRWECAASSAASFGLALYIGGYLLQ